MSNKITKVNLSNFLFCIAWLIYVSSYVILKETELTYIFNTNILYTFFEVIVMLILCMKIVFVDKYTKKTIIIYLILSLLIIISYVSSSSNSILFMFIFIISASNIDMKKVIKYDSNMRLIILFLVCFSCFLGLLPNFTRLINGNYKQALGFVHPNTFAIFSVSIILEKIYLLKEFKLKNLIFVLFLLLVIMHFSNSRSCVYLLIVISMAMLIFKNSKMFFNSKIIKCLLIMLPVLLCLLSFYFVDQYKQGSKYAIKVDKIITGRLYYASNFMNDYDLTLFGREIEIISTRKALSTNKKAQILDMAYINLAVNKGIIMLVIFIASLSLIQLLSFKYKKTNILFLNTFFIVLAFSEGYSTVIVYNFIFLSIPYLLKIKKEKNNEQS